ncbi:winged helix-turn-helix transcriptional regulator [Streptomyces anthocyanicus]
MRVRDVAAQLPFVSEQFVGKRLATMHADGLVIRDDGRRGAPYGLSALGTSLAPVLRTMSDWSRTHPTQEPMAEAERVEDALRRLHLRHSNAVIQALDSADGQMRFVHIAEAARLDNGLARQRLSGFKPMAWSRGRAPGTKTLMCSPMPAMRWGPCTRVSSTGASPSRCEVEQRQRQQRAPTSAFRWGGRRHPNRGGPTAERRRVQHHVQPRASAATAGAGGRDRSVGTGPGPVTGVRTRGHSAPPRHTRSLQRLPPLRTRIRSPPSLPETRPCTPLMTRTSTKRCWSAPCTWLVPTGPAKLASPPSPSGHTSTSMKAPASSS